MQPAVIPAQPQAYVAPAGQPGVAYPPNTAVIIQTAPNTYQQAPLSYANKQSLALGISQVLCGIVSILFNILEIAIISDCFTAGNIGYGIWCGVFYLGSGALGIAAYKNPTYCMLVAHMVMSIISTCFAGIQLIIASISAGVGASCYNYNYYPYYSYDYSTLKGFSLTLTFIALVEAIAAIWASAICCSAMCCKTGPQHGAVIYSGQQQYATATTVANPGQIVYQQPHMQQQHQQPQLPPQPQMQQQYAYPQPQYVENMATAPQVAPAYAAQPPAYADK